MRGVRLWCDFRSRRKRKLASDNHRLVSFHTTLDYGQIALLALAGIDRTKLDRVVRFHYEHERPALANLHRLRWHKRFDENAGGGAGSAAVDSDGYIIAGGRFKVARCDSRGRCK